LKRVEKREWKILSRKKENKVEEYDVSGSESGSDTDNDDFILKRKKPKTRQLVVKERTDKKPKQKDDDYLDLKDEMNEMKDMIQQLALLQKKQNKKARKKSGGTKLAVVNMPNTPPEIKAPSSHDSLMEALRKSLM